MMSADRNLRLLTFSTLYPNAARPGHGVFVENRLRHLLESGEATARVLAPVPWFPFGGGLFGRYADFAKAPAAETRHGIAIEHPRYPVIPKVGMTLAPLLLYAAARRALGRALRDGHRFDLIDAHYFYPDGIAAVLLGRAFGLPVTVTARGTDLNVIPQYRLPRAWIEWAAARADGLITVSAGLAERLAALGVPDSKVTVLRNGVDPERFKPVSSGEGAGDDRKGSPLALSVGNLVPLKGHDLVISALPSLPGLRLDIVGDGPERQGLEDLARSLGVADRVRFVGRVAHERMPEVYSAADVLVLASEREGWPNVLLEAMACGAPVVATRVSGASEIVTKPAAGLLLPERSVAALSDALASLLAAPPERSATRAHALDFTWEATTRGQIELFRAIVQRRGAAA